MLKGCFVLPRVWVGLRGGWVVPFSSGAGLCASQREKVVAPRPMGLRARIIPVFVPAWSLPHRARRFEPAFAFPQRRLRGLPTPPSACALIASPLCRACPLRLSGRSRSVVYSSALVRGRGFASLALFPLRSNRAPSNGFSANDGGDAGGCCGSVNQEASRTFLIDLTRRGHRPRIPPSGPFGLLRRGIPTESHGSATPRREGASGTVGATLRLVETRQLRKRHPRQNAKARSTALRPNPHSAALAPRLRHPDRLARIAPTHPLSRSASRKARDGLRPRKTA